MFYINICNDDTQTNTFLCDIFFFFFKEIVLIGESLRYKSNKT